MRKSKKIVITSGPNGAEMTTIKNQIRDKDLAGVEAALRRAAKRARTIAEQTHTPLVLYKSGRVIKEFVGKEKSRQGS